MLLDCPGCVEFDPRVVHRRPRSPAVELDALSAQTTGSCIALDSLRAMSGSFRAEGDACEAIKPKADTEGLPPAPGIRCSDEQQAAPEMATPTANGLRHPPPKQGRLCKRHPTGQAYRFQLRPLSCQPDRAPRAVNPSPRVTRGTTLSITSRYPCPRAWIGAFPIGSERSGEHNDKGGHFSGDLRAAHGREPNRHINRNPCAAHGRDPNRHVNRDVCGQDRRRDESDRRGC